MTPNSSLLLAVSGPCFSQGNTPKTTDLFIELIGLATYSRFREARMFLVLCIIIDKISFTQCVKEKREKAAILKMKCDEGLPVINSGQI